MQNFLYSTAYAQTTQAAGAAGGAAAKPPTWVVLFPYAVIFIFLWLFIFRPQQKKLKDHQSFLAALKRGDEVITTGGIFGEVTGITEKFITLQIADNVRIKVLRSQILGQSGKEGNP